MKVTTTNGLSFRLIAEDAADDQLICALNQHRWVRPVRHVTGPKDAAGGFPVIGFDISTDPREPQALAADAGRKALGAIGELFRLGLAQAADHGLAVASAADPKAQEALSTSVVQLQLVPGIGDQGVGQQKRGIESVVGTHGCSLDGGASVGGAA